MEIIQFNEPLLVEELERLPAPLRLVFATASAERLVPAYRRFSQRTGRGDAVTLTALLERLWSDVLGDKMNARQIQENIDTAMRLIPQEDGLLWAPEQASAEDAAAAVAYALRCRQNHQAQEAAWAARRAYEALDHYIIGQQGIDLNVPGAEERVLSHPLVQAELLRQRRDVEELMGTNPQDPAAVVQRLLQRAKAEAEFVFGPIARIDPRNR